MECPRCHQSNAPTAKFCSECGAALARTCARCNTPLPASAKFCPECAHPVAEPTAAAGRFATPDMYTPAYLAEKILTSRGAIEGERKQVTVLFADLKGSMQLLANRDPEDARNLLDPVLSRMIEAIHHYEGTVNQVMGDGIMALFGAPLAHEDHAVRACYAALRMQDAVKRYAQEANQAVEIRVGLNSGQVVVRSIGSDLHMDYTAVGETTHLAARFEQNAVPGSILMSVDTMRLAEGYIQVAPLGPLRVKGLGGDVEAYELLGVGPVRSRLQAALARGLTRFVGRAAELERIREALRLAGTGHGQVMALVGEPGVGKSRLVWEVLHSPQCVGWLVLESRSVSYGKATTFLPFIDLLKQYFQIEDRDEPRKIREKVVGKLVSLDEALSATIPAFLNLLDVSVNGDSGWQALDPPVRRQRTRDAVKHLLLRESRVQPLLLVFEDLHWIDSETQVLLDMLIDSLPAARILVLVNYRPQYEHKWANKSYYTQFRLDALPPDMSQDFLRALLGADPSLEPLWSLLMNRAEGNPFFLEEGVRELIETGVLVGERGAYRVGKALSTIQVPATVQSVLAARIDRLEPADKHLLQSAAVIGKNFPFRLLQAVIDENGETLRRGLAHLQTAEFVYETSLFPDLEYSFKHAVTHEVAYGSLLRDRRRALHARIVEAIETLDADRLAEQVERLAHHAMHGEVWAKAAQYFQHAGTKAAARSSYREAVTHLEQALVALRHLPETDATRKQAIDLRFALRNALVSLGRPERILEYLHEAEALAEALGDRRRLGRVAAYMAGYFWWVAEYDQALRSGERAHAIAAELGDVPLHIFVNLSLGQIYYSRADYRRTIDVTRQNVDALREAPAGAELRATVAHLLSRSWLIDSMADLGNFREAIEMGQEGVALAESIDHPYSRIVSYIGLGYIFLLQGDLARAIRVLEPGLALCEGNDLPVDSVLITAYLGSAYAQAGQLQLGLTLLEGAVASTRAIDFRAGHSLIVRFLGEAALLAGRSDEAARLGRQALDLARAHHEPGYEAWSLRLLGAAAAHAEAPDVQSADELSRTAGDLAASLGMRPLVAHTHLDRGRLHARAGDRDKATTHLQQASALFRDLDMTAWVTRAEEALRR